jgi:hypothetical protein
MNKALRILVATATLLGSLAAQAAGVLYTNDKPGNPQPLRWNTSKPIPVYTDLGVFTYDFDGVTPFITNQRANELVAYAIGQWSQVPTSTLKAYVAGSFAQVPSIGVDITAANAAKVYGQFNGGGMHVVYDTDGSILEEVFGVPKWAVLGIAFPEIGEDTDGDGQVDTITEATALMNGFAVGAGDPLGLQFVGVMTHEFGHALNLSHSQVNGPMAAFSYPGFQDLYPGVPGCVAPRHIPGWGGNDMPHAYVETMFPFINPYSENGREMASVNMPDDIAAISNLYPTAAYKANTGSISGTLRLKDGRTPYSGINIIARNVADPLRDAVSAMSGDMTQGKVGPDGRFTIRNLNPGQSYVVYMEEIVAGGYPTRPTALVSQGEYWNAAESADPATDRACDATPIVAQAGVTKVADLTFNGYASGVQYYPVTEGYLTDLVKNGGRAAGVFGATQFTWSANAGIQVLPSHILANNGSWTRNGQQLLVNTDLDKNGINSAALLDMASGKITNLGSLNGDTCGGSGSIGESSSYGWAVSDDGRVAVGTAYVDSDNDGNCQNSFKPEVVPFLWTEKGGMRKLDTAGHDWDLDGWMRAHAISGDGTVALGGTNSQNAQAWVNGGPRVDLWKKYGGIEAYAVNRDGSKVAFDTMRSEVRTIDGFTYTAYLNSGVAFWNAKTGALRKLPPLRWCADLVLPPYYDWGTGNVVDPCAGGDLGSVEREFGQIPVTLFSSNDDGSVMIGRMGSLWIGNLDGVMWVEGVGWIRMGEFFRKQGVAEAFRLGMNNPISINGAGNEMVGGLLGVPQSWYVDMKQVFVCQNGASVQTGFPNGFVDKIKSGAKMGRCEFQN